MPDAIRLGWPDQPQLKLEMLSDWHVGSGMGRPGNIDRLIARDQDGLPYVPAKTLTGIWRDAAERMAHGLDGGVPGPWSQWVACVFGDQPARGETDPSTRPRPALLSVRPARLRATLRARLRGAEQEACLLRGALTFVKPGVKIDSQSGRAVDDHLRFEEMARLHSVLEAPISISLPADPAERNAVIALLALSTRLVERLGGKRRRGAGRCRLTLAGVDADPALQWLEANPRPPRPRASAGDADPDPWPMADEIVQPSTGWMLVSYRLDPSTPLAVSSRTVGNVVESLDFVPGTLLLGYFTDALQRLGIADVRRAILRGDLRVMPCTVEVDGQSSRPVPLALFQEKEAGSLANPATLVNRLVDPDLAEDPQRKQCRGGYLAYPAASGQMPRHHLVEMTLRTHNTVDEESQRPTTEVGGVYSYEAIAAPRLHGELRMRRGLYDQVSSDPAWISKLGGECVLGRSKKDDYGRARLQIDGPATEPGPTPPCQGNKLYVWVISDVLLRDERLRPAPTPGQLGKALGNLLGVTLTELPGFSRVRRTESWHGGWCLPRPSLMALQAGTSLAYELDGALLADAVTRRALETKLAEIEAAGIGERTAEGYGQLKFNDPLLAQSPRTWTAARVPRPVQPTTAHEIPPADPCHDLALRIQEEAWREQIHRTAMALANERREELLGWHENTPPMSQLGGLRAVVLQLRSWTDHGLVKSWLDHLAKNKRRAEKWHGTIPKIKTLFEKPGAIWSILAPESWPSLTPAAPQRLRVELWAVAVRTFVDACIRAHKRQLDQKERRRIHGT